MRPRAGAARRVRRARARARAEPQPRRGAEPAPPRWGAAALLRQDALGVGRDVVRDLPRSRPRLRPAERPGRAARRAADGPAAGTRAVPSLRYKEFTPAYADLLDNPDGVSAPGPGGGFAWDGRADTLAEQAKTPAAVALRDGERQPGGRGRARSQAAPYARAVPAGVRRPPCSPTDARPSTTRCRRCRRSRTRTSSFHPYTSKFDLYAGNKIGGTLHGRRDARLQGLRRPEDAATAPRATTSGAGLTAARRCSPTSRTRRSASRATRASPPTRTRRTSTSGSAVRSRTDHLPGEREPNAFCGLFKTPTLRNVATRKVVLPQRRHPLAGAGDPLLQHARHAARALVPDGRRPRARRTPDPRLPDATASSPPSTSAARVQKYDDLPAAHRGNIDPQLPLDGRARGAKPPMTEQHVAGPDLLPGDAHRRLPPARDAADRRDAAWN